LFERGFIFLQTLSEEMLKPTDYLMPCSLRFSNKSNDSRIFYSEVNVEIADLR